MSHRHFKIEESDARVDGKFVRDTGDYTVRVTKSANEFNTGAKRAASSLFRRGAKGTVTFALRETTVGSNKDIRVYQATKTRKASPTSHSVKVYKDASGKKWDLVAAELAGVRTTAENEEIKREFDIAVNAVPGMREVRAFYERIGRAVPSGEGKRKVKVHAS